LVLNFGNPYKVLLSKLTLLHSKAAAECSSRWRKQWLHLLLLKMFGVNLRQSAVRAFVVAAAVGVGGADFEGAAGTVVVIVAVDISLRSISEKKTDWGNCRGERECGNGGAFRILSEIAWLLFVSDSICFVSHSIRKDAVLRKPKHWLVFVLAL